jgi:hypothetical protein
MMRDLLNGEADTVQTVGDAQQTYTVTTPALGAARTATGMAQRHDRTQRALKSRRTGWPAKRATLVTPSFGKGK